MPQNKIKRFIDSVRPEVALKKRATCSLKLHFYGCLRQYVNALEYKAQIDPERFIYAAESYFVEYCKRFTRRDGQGKPYDKRMIRRCKKFLRETGIISSQVKRIRNGRLMEGFILIHHDDLACTEGNTCIVLPESSLASSLASSLSSSLVTDEKAAQEFPNEFPSTPLEIIEDTDTSSNGEQKSFGKGKSDFATNAVNAANSENAVLSQTKPCAAYASLSPVQILNLELQTLGQVKRR